MQLTSVFAAAGLAASTTNAFLLPPDLSKSEGRPGSILPIAATDALPIHADVSTLMVKCPGCPVRIPHHREAKIVNDIPSHLELNFQIKSSGSEDDDSLLLNGFEIYPNPEFSRGGLTAGVRADFSHRQVMNRPPHFRGPKPATVQKLGYGMQTSRVTEESIELVLIELDIIEVGDVFVDGIPNIQIKLLKTPQNKLMFADVKVVESEAKQNNPMDKQEECATLLCKWKAVMMQKLAGLRVHKGCGGRPAHAQNGEQVQSDDETKDQDKTLLSPSSEGEDGRQPNPRHRNWGLLFKNIASHILLPVAVGILAGVFASVLGMLVGTSIVYLWRFATRRGGSRRHHRHGHHHKASRAEAAALDEKSGLMAHQEEEVDVPPPVYVEEGLVVLDDKKNENVA